MTPLAGKRRAREGTAASREGDASLPPRAGPRLEVFFLLLSRPCIKAETGLLGERCLRI